jgi:LPXTG-motif cell wall-anchored protein
LPIQTTRQRDRKASVAGEAIRRYVNVDAMNVAVTDDGFIALATDGIYKWTRSPESLPNTGFTGATATFVGVTLILGGAIMLTIRRRPASR